MKAKGIFLLSGLLFISQCVAIAVRADTPVPPAATSPASSSTNSSSAAAPAVSASPASSAAPGAAVTTTPSQKSAAGGVSATAPACSCMASQPDGSTKKHKGGPVRKVLHGLTREVGSDLSDMGKDSMFVFSAQDFDPYSKTPGRNPKRPYVVGEAEYVDGSSAEIMKFPDRSLRIYGGYADGTYACPISTDSSNFVVYYPNGVRGELTLHADGTAVIKRPDNTTTRITKTNGGYKITNDKLGYMGEINPDTTGLNYQFARSNNADNNLQNKF